MKYPILINGEMRTSPETIKIMNPANGELAGEVPFFQPQEMVQEAFEAAKKAAPFWKMLPSGERLNLIKRFREEFKKHGEELAMTMMSEIAKNLDGCRDEVKRSLEYIDGTIEIFEKEFQTPKIIGADEHHIVGKTGKFYREPLGVVLAISPFNYPVNLLLSKLIPALIVGNTVVYKGATQGSLCAAMISQFFYDANFPAGVVNCVVGQGSEIGDLLVSNPLVDMVTFTGGTKVGKKIISEAAGKQLLLELGGKDPALIVGDADLELASHEIVKGAFNYNGQRCTAIKRVLVPAILHKELIGMLNKLVNNLSVGMPEANSTITPLISQKSVDYALELLQDAEQKGAILQQEIRANRNLMYPIIVDHVTPEMRLAWEEPFAPILPIIEYHDIEEAIQIINDSQYGLQASIFTGSDNQAVELAKRIEVGTVNINRASSRGPDIFPFSGVKDSGLGVQGLRDALYAMTRVKGIIFNK